MRDTVSHRCLSSGRVRYSLLLSFSMYLSKMSIVGVSGWEWG